MATEDGFVDLTVFSLELIMAVDMQWNITIVNRIYLFELFFFHGHVSFSGVFGRDE